MMGAELYVYYNVATAAAAAAATAVRTLQADLMHAHPGLSAHWLRREETPGASQQTWMEIYRLEGSGINATLQTTIETAAAKALGDAITGPRHVERFLV